MSNLSLRYNCHRNSTFEQTKLSNASCTDFRLRTIEKCLKPAHKMQSLAMHDWPRARIVGLRTFVFDSAAWAEAEVAWRLVCRLLTERINLIILRRLSSLGEACGITVRNRSAQLSKSLYRFAPETGTRNCKSRFKFRINTVWELHRYNLFQDNRSTIAFLFHDL